MLKVTCNFKCNDYTAMFVLNAVWHVQSNDKQVNFLKTMLSNGWIPCELSSQPCFKVRSNRQRFRNVPEVWSGPPIRYKINVCVL